MARLYIANPTRQRQIVCYRLDFDNEGNPKDTNRKFQPHHQQEIEPGRQIQLGRDFHPNQISEIVEQLAVFGLIGEVDVPKLRAADFDNLRAGVVPFVFNIDRPVSSENMRKVMAHNANILIQDGRERRKKAAIASSATIQQTVENQFAAAGFPDTPSERQTIAFEQEEQSEAGEPRVEEGYKVDKNAPVKPKPPKRGPGRRRDAA